MEGGESGEPTTPFWARTDSSSSSSSSSNSSMKPLMAAALAASIFFIIFFPSILSSFRPSFFKNGWDLLNFVLVVFAVLCGVLGRNPAPAGDDTDKTTPPILTTAPVTTFRRMRSSSYPDLRQESLWGLPTDDGWRFSDDIEVYRNQHWRSDHPRSDLRHLHAEPIVKTIQVDTMEVKPSSPVRSRSPPTPPPPPPRPRQHHHQPRRRQVKRSDIPPPPPPPPSTPPRQQSVIERNLHRKKSTGAKDIAAALALYYQKKRRRGSSSKIKKIHSNDEIITDSATKPTPPPAPPPPPPPPPPSMFHNLFASSKKGSSKKKISSPPSPPPPPSLPTSRRSATTYPLPPSPLGPWQPHSSNPPPKVNPKTHYSFSNSFELPPPPPPPPPSLPSSPLASFVKEAAAEPLFCPSPDVNNKAEMFIARFRAGLKLEKLNSIKAKEKEQDQQEGQVV